MKSRPRAALPFFLNIMQIQLDRLAFHAFHGVLPQEKAIGGNFEVDLLLDIDDADARSALFADRLEGTVNYAEVYDLVKAEMAVPSELLEHVAARMAVKLIHTFRLLRQVKVTLRKCVPPITGFSGAGISVSFSLRRKLVVWDFDGTIADTSRGIVRTMTATFNECGYPVPDEVAICRTIGLPLTESIAALAGIEGEPLAHAVSTYRRLFETLGRGGVTLFPGIAEAIGRQHREGNFVAIATSRGHESVENLCTELGIRSCIDSIMACEDTAECKPNPAPVLVLFRQFNVHPADTTVIGDTSFDMEMGRRAGVFHNVGVTWGNHDEADLRKGGATRIVTDAESL